MAGVERFERADQTAGPRRTAHGPGADAGGADPVRGELAQRVPVVGFHGALDRQRTVAPSLRPPLARPPDRVTPP